MIRSDHSKFNKPAIILYPGEHYATAEDVALSTVSGSCLVVTLYDKYRHIGGLGHFILPGLIGTSGLNSDDISSYGVTQLEYIFGEFVKLGGDRKDVRANVFGAAHTDRQNKINEEILKTNVMFIHKFFSGEKIPVDHLDLAGEKRRKIIFFPKTGKTFRKILLNNEAGSEIIRLEKEYIAKAFKEVHEKTKFILFD